MTRYFVTVDYQGPRGDQSNDVVVEADTQAEAADKAIHTTKTVRDVRKVTGVRAVVIQPRTARGAYGRRA